MHRFDRLDYADRWLADGFRVLQENPPGFIGTLEVEMTRVRALVQRMKARGLPGSYAGVVVRAAGLAMSRHPDMHALLVGSRRMRPDHVSIGLSVSGEATAAPVMRIEEVETKSVVAVCEELKKRAPEVRAEDAATLAKLRRWGWLIPTGWLRRFVLRRVLSSLRFRRLFGSLQVTVVPGVDIVSALAYGAPAVVGLGRIQERVVARDGKPVVRLMATMSYTGDHKLFDGERVVRIMSEIRGILESDELLAEIPEPAEPVTQTRSEAPAADADSPALARAIRG
jgi:pyruvate/2-oxoglutarate dehydrogenase complex dihydrolipoamide acyltransferase (E2) component